MAAPLGPVVITARDIYDELVLVRRAVDQLVSDHADAERQLADHETRIRGLERGRWPLPSIAVLVSLGALGAAIVPLVAR